MRQLGGPFWTVPLGRRDSTTASKTNAENDLPPPSSDLQGLTTKFSNKGLSVTDMVALSGTLDTVSLPPTKTRSTFSFDTDF
jgi:peroxidase